MNSKLKLTADQIIKDHKTQFTIWSYIPFWVKCLSFLVALLIASIGFLIVFRVPAISTKYDLNGFIGTLIVMFSVVAWGYLNFLSISKIPNAKKGFFSVDKGAVNEYFQSKFNQYLQGNIESNNLDTVIDYVDKCAREKLQAFIIFGSIILVLFAGIFPVYFNYVLNISNVKHLSELNIYFTMFIILSIAVSFLAFILRDMSYILSNYNRLKGLEMMLKNFKTKFEA